MLRKSDLPGRWGGEEFIALLHSDADAATGRAAERVRLRSGGKALCDTSHGPVAVTLSGGCAQLTGRATACRGWSGAPTRALYAAKHGGRNRILDAADEPDTQPADLGGRLVGGPEAAGSAGSTA